MRNHMKSYEPYIRVLRKIYARLKDSNVNWVVTGSLGFALQGVPIKLNDIDIQTDKAGAYKIEELFSEFVVEKVTFSTSKKIRSHFGKMMIDGIEVEIMGDVQKRSEESWEAVDLNEYKRFVEVEGMRIPVLSLEYEYQAYLKLGRLEKAKLLKEWLRKNGR